MLTLRGLAQICATIATCLFATAAQAQDPIPAIESWLKVPPDRGALVLVIDAGVKAVTVGDVKKNVVISTKWDYPQPFIKQYRVSPGTYFLYLPGVIHSISVTINPGSVVTLRLARVTLVDGTSGVQITVTYGRPIVREYLKLNRYPATVRQTATDIGDLSKAGSVIQVNTDPPWPIPPPPPPPPK